MAEWTQSGQILDRIQEARTIILHRHIRPDPDALGSQLGLQHVLRQAYPDKNVLAVGGMTPDLGFFGKMEHVDASDYEGALVIVLDTANQDRIDGEHVLKGKYMVKIDHHPDEDAYADVQVVDTTVSSTSELLVTLLEQWGIPLTQEAAYLFYAGIVGDTGRFQFRNTTPRTFEVASKLLTYDIDTNRLYRHMYRTTLASLQLQGYVLQNVQVTENGVGYIAVTSEVLARFGATPEMASQLVNSFSGLDGLKCWAMFVENPDEIRVRLRSKGPVINEVAKRYGGGGHPMASGARLDSWEEMDSLLQDLNAVASSFQFE